MYSEANLPTAHASEILDQLCQQLKERAAAHPDMGIEVAWSATSGSVDFGWARCTLQADPDSLDVRVEADESDDVERVKELLTRHLERHGSDDQPMTWDDSGEPAPSLRDPHRKELMREFHHRARQHSRGE